MFSGAGGALARRRRDISSFPQSSCYLIFLLLLVFLTFMFCKPSLSLSILHETLQICNIDRRRPPASFLSVDILAPWIPDPAKEETFESKRTSTLNSETSLSSFSRSLESRSIAILVEYLPHRIPQKATLTSPCSLMRFFSTLITKLSNLKLNSWSSVPLPEPEKKLAATLIYQVTSLHGLGPISSPTKPNCQVIGPTSTSTQPICQVVGPIHNLIWHWPRSESRNYFANPYFLMSRFLTSMNGLDPLFRTVSTSVGFTLHRIQPSLSKSSWKISKEHYTLKIPLPSTLHLRLSRFDWNSNLSHSSQSRCSFMKPFVRRLHLDNKLPLLLVWLRIYLDNLLLESSRTLAFEASILNELGIMIQSIRNCGYRCVFMFPSSTRLIHKPVKLHLINFLKLPLKNLKTSGIMIPIQCSGGYHNIFLQVSASYMERTLSSYMERTPSSYMERTLATSYNLWLPVFEPRKQPIFHTSLLLCVEILVPARFKVLESSSTSLCQSTVTNISPPEVFVEVPSTHQDFACANMLFSYCLQVLVDLKSYYLIYLCIVLMNVLIFHVLNFGSLNPLYPCIVLCLL